MGQSRTGVFRRIFVFSSAALLVIGLLSIGCDRDPSAAAPTTPPAVRLASLSPAATDLLLSMNPGERLIAVSNFDGDRADARHLPRVGDYQNIDWEKLAGLKPTAMIVQGRPDRMPTGLKPRAQSLGIKVVNIQIDALSDIFTAAGVLGDALGDPGAAKVKVAAIQGQLDAIRRRVKDRPRVRTLLVVDSSGRHVAGHGTFLSDLLEIAGGENVVPPASGQWPSIDREMLIWLKPEAILQLLPAASPQVLEKAKAVWPELAELPAVKAGRVYPITDWFIHQPGARVGDTAAVFADKLHGAPKPE